MSYPVYLGIDVGTQSIRVLAVDASRRVLVLASEPLTSHRDGVRHDPTLAAQRGINALNHELKPGEQNARVLLAAHSTLIMLVLCRLLGIPLPHYRLKFPRLDNGAITELMLTDEGASLLSFNSPFTVQNRASRDHVKK